MKIVGNPNEHIIDYEKGKEMFCLDENGEFFTDERMLIEWIRQEKSHLTIVDENEVNEPEQSNSGELSYQEMKKLAKEKGINTNGMTKEQIAEVLKAGE